MSVLSKDVVYVDGVPGIDPVPPTAPHPAYCIDTTTTVPTYTYVLVQLHNADGSPTNPPQFQWIAISTGTQVVTQHVCFPADPGSPGTPGRDAVPAHVDYQLGWNGGAISIATFAGDQQFTLSIDETAAGVVCGLNDGNADAGYLDIEFGIYAEHGLFRIIEAGAIQAAHLSFVESDVFAIVRRGDTIEYYQNSTLVYTSLRKTSIDLRADCSLYAGTDSIIAAAISDIETTFGANTATLAADTCVDDDARIADTDFCELLADSGDTAALMEVWNEATLNADSGDTEAFLVEFPLLAGSDTAGALNADTGATEAVMESGLLVPEFNYLDGGESGETAVWMLALPGVLGTLSADTSPDDDAKLGNFAFVELAASTDDPSDGVAMLGYAYGTWVEVSILVATVPMQTADAYADVLPVDYPGGGSYAPGHIVASVPMQTAVLYGGGEIRATVPKQTASATATVDTAIAIAATVPFQIATVTATAGATGTIAATVPFQSATAQGGGEIAATVPFQTASLSASVDQLGRLAATVPFQSAEATATVSVAASIAATVPMQTAAGWNYIAATVPFQRASLVANDPSYTYGIAYTMTLDDEGKAVTRYTNFNFVDIIRYGTKHYAFGPAGVYELTGDTDDGAPIEWALQHGKAALGVAHNSRTDAVYVLGSFTDQATLSVSVDDGEEWTYTEAAPDDKLRTLRFTPGKGLTGHYWQFGLSGTGPAKIVRAEILNRTLSRKVRSYGR